MTGILNIIHIGLDYFFRPLAGMPPFWGMFAISAVTGVLMVIIYKYTSNQEGIARAKELIKAHLLETWIYREQVEVMLRAQKKVLWANLIYMAHNFKPLLVMMIPVLILLIDINFRYGLEPISPGQSVLLETTRRDAVAIEEMDEAIEVPAGVTLDAPPVHIETLGKTIWRLKVNAPGRYILKIKAGGAEFDKSLDAGEQGPRVVSSRSQSVVDNIFYPGEPALPKEGVLKSIEINYPTQSPAIPGTPWRPHWLIQYFVISIIFGFILKGPLKVEI
jgi:uncharacterized membrane protein (DUF106 family)